MARTIVRYSINDSSDASNRVRAALEYELPRFDKLGTGAYQAIGSLALLAHKLRHVLSVLEEQEAAHGDGTVDHLLVYLDDAG
jgi:hypothetical protein